MPKFILTFDFYDNPKPRIVRIDADSLYQATNKMEKVARKIFSQSQYDDIKTCMAQEEIDPNVKTPKFDPAVYKVGSEKLCYCIPIIENGKANHEPECPQYEDQNALRLEDVPF